MAKTTLADKLAKVAQRKAKAEQDEARLKDRQRVERTRQLIELGGLVAKAGIDVKLTRFGGASQAFAGGFSDAQDPSAVFA
ncbi:MAG: conjugal transfer protein TraD [Xanthobacteraceae bacterium]